MKNGLLIWNVVLTLVAGYLLFSHFTIQKEGGASRLKALQKIRHLLIRLFVLLISKWIQSKIISRWLRKCRLEIDGKGKAI